ncbi:MAG: RNA 2',3'-cyclic phosphodiesterase [Burkholderiales bacterium]|nr:RNA 2',3'-cyclic phosphodiesterase [Burkholderiales bacterium]
MPAADAEPAHVAAVGAARWFIALWPDDAARDALQALQSRWSWPPQARPTHADRLHLTLHFLGPLPDAALASLREALAGVRAAPQRWSLRRAAIWKGGVAVVEPARIPAAAQALHDALAEVLRVQGLPLEDRPWRPHVTLARRASGAAAPAAFEPIEWTARRFELVGSDGGYRRVARWPLAVRPRHEASPRRAAVSPALRCEVPARAPPAPGEATEARPAHGDPGPATPARGARGRASGRSSG